LTDTESKEPQKQRPNGLPLQRPQGSKQIFLEFSSNDRAKNSSSGFSSSSPASRFATGSVPELCRSPIALQPLNSPPEHFFRQEYPSPRAGGIFIPGHSSFRFAVSFPFVFCLWWNPRYSQGKQADAVQGKINRANVPRAPLSYLFSVLGPTRKHPESRNRHAAGR